MQKKDAAAKKSEAKDSKDKKSDPPKFDLKNEALIPYLKGEKPVIVTADEGHDIEVAMGLAQEFHLKIVLAHVTHSQDILDKIAAWHVPVIVRPHLRVPPR